MISFMLAMSRNRVIGQNNELPWKLPADLAYFKKTTSGHTVIMGRKTFESIRKPLPNRTNVIMTKDERYQATGCIIVHSLREAMEEINQDEEAFVIGGAKIFRIFLPYVSRLYITQIDHDFEGDTYFPIMNMDKWRLVCKEKGKKDEKNPYDYFFLVYEKLPKNSVRA